MDCGISFIVVPWRLVRSAASDLISSIGVGSSVNETNDQKSISYSHGCWYGSQFFADTIFLLSWIYETYECLLFSLTQRNGRLSSGTDPSGDNIILVLYFFRLWNLAYKGRFFRCGNRIPTGTIRYRRRRFHRGRST